MLRGILRFTLPLTFLFGMLSLGTRALGAGQPPNSALVGFREGCENLPQPCWYGILPGFTNMGGVARQLDRLGYKLGLGLNDRSLMYVAENQSPGCVEVYYDRDAARVSSIILGCSTIRVGDILTALGEPDAQEWYGEQDVDWIYGRVMIRLSEAWSHSVFDGSQNIRLVRSSGTPRKGALMPWHGMLPEWRYCQFEPEYAGCRS